MNRAWPAMIVLIALIVFMAQTTPVMALVILVVGGVLLTLVFGTARITRLRSLIRSQNLRR